MKISNMSLVSYNGALVLKVYANCQWRYVGEDKIVDNINDAVPLVVGGELPEEQRLSNLLDATLDFVLR
jgi:hypothetical protein